jgi:hypothetical protein
MPHEKLDPDTICANPKCLHPRKWHKPDCIGLTQNKKGNVVFCRCPAFKEPTNVPAK